MKMKGKSYLFLRFEYCRCILHKIGMDPPSHTKATRIDQPLETLRKESVSILAR